MMVAFEGSSGVSLWDFVNLKEEKWEEFWFSLADNET